MADDRTAQRRICLVVLRARHGRLDVLDHDDGRIDEHAQCNGEPAKAHQVGRQTHIAHQEKGRQHRQRQSGRHDQGCPHPTQEQIQRNDDQHAGFNQRANHGIGRTGDQLAAVVEDVGRHALWQLRAERIEPRLYRLDQLAGIAAAQAQHQSFNRFAVAVFADSAVAGRLAQPHGCHIADRDRRRGR